MANPLTGDFEAVLQVRLRQIDGILATLHQSRLDPNTSPTLAHNGSVRIGDTPPWLDTEATRFSEWVGLAAPNDAVTADTIGVARDALMPRTPSGATQRLQDTLAVLASDRTGRIPTGRVQGLAEFELSSVTITLTPGTVNEVTVHADVRARFVSDPGAAGLPGPIHGTVTATYTLGRVVLPDGRAVLRVQLSGNSNQIQFEAARGSGLGPDDVRDIVIHVRSVMRKHFGPLDLALPADFAFTEFTRLGSGTAEAIVLPLQLSGAPAPGSVTALSNHFVGANDFALAVSKEFVQRSLDALMDAIRNAASRLRISLRSVVFGTANYTASVATLAVSWKPGALEVAGAINFTTPSWWAPNGFVSFRQDVGVVLDVNSQNVSVIPLGEPAVDESWFISHGTAVNNVKQARDAALPGASAAFNASFAGARQRLATTLASFDKWSSVRYEALELTVDGIIVRGAIETRHRYAPVVTFDTIDGGAAFNAVRSWVPGGRIATYDWTFVENTHALPWHNRTRHTFFDHTYVFPAPAGVASRDICLAIRGSRRDADGREEPVEAGDICSNSSHEPLLVMPSWWMDVFIGEWLPDPPFDAIVNSLIASHVSMVGEPRGPRDRIANTLVHFAGREMERPLEGLARAVEQMRRRDVSPLLVLVLREGAFSVRRNELEGSLGEISDEFRGRLIVTEDFIGGWTKALAAPEGASTHVINARGEFAWRHDGRLDAGAVATALDEHALDAPTPQRVPLKLKLRAGLPMPDCVFTDERGIDSSLRRLRGRPILLTFFRAWSAPCVRELRHLQQSATKDGPFVIAVSGGETRETLADFRRRHELTFPLIYDPDQIIASRYGVRCWPTTVSINEEGIVDRIQFGITHKHLRDAGGNGHEPHH